MPRFYLDEDLPDLVAAICRQAGIDIVTTRERGRGGTSDPEQLLYAAQEGRILVSQNRGDMHRFSREFAERGLPHAGVLLLPDSIHNADAPGIARAIVAYMAEHPDDMPPYMVDYLRATSERGSIDA